MDYVEKFAALIESEASKVREWRHIHESHFGPRSYCITVSGPKSVVDTLFDKISLRQTTFGDPLCESSLDGEEYISRGMISSVPRVLTEAASE